jgi:chromosome segregation ATPase
MRFCLDAVTRGELKQMSAKRSRHILSSIAVVLFILGISQTALGQNNKQPDDKEVLQALLREVSMLRQALQTLQRMSVDTYRSQLLVDRIRVSREDIRRLTASLNETRDTLMRTQRAIPNYADQTKLLETQLQMEVDQTKKVRMEYELKSTKDTLEEYKSQVDVLKEREQSLANELRIEQTKLDGLENRLDQLERGIDADRQKLENDKPAVKTP